MEATKAIKGLKEAANYTKLAMHEFGPRSFKKGQGALLKVIYKFSQQGSISKDSAEKILDWRGKQLRHVAKKAQDNGYINIEEDEMAFTMSLTEKGKEVIEKRMEAEDRAAEAILEGLSEDEIEQLVSITSKISETCKGLGVDYSKIEKRKSHHGHKGHHGHGCRKHHGHHDEAGSMKANCHRHDHHSGHGCHKHHGHHGCCHGHKGSPQYVFVFEGHHHH